MLLYIHIPFCDSKCHYCAFNSYVSLHHLRDSYVEALLKQLRYELNNINIDELKTVFIGGGTPSTLAFKHYEKIFAVLKPYINDVEEITIEANPNSATLHWLKDMYSLGINRISFGVQSFNDEKLDFLGRNHNSKMAIEVIINAKDVGFEHINCDIIYDTRIDNKELLKKDIKIIATLPIDHISAYSLIIEEGTKFFIKSNVRVENIDMTNELFDMFLRLGFIQYEISNFAKNKEARSKHNIGYWQHKEYIGIGAGAVGCKNNKRVYVKKDINRYINSPLEYDEIEVLTKEDIKTEKVLLGFRSIVGVSKDILNTSELNKANNLEEEGKITFKNNKYYAVDYMLADELSLYILD